MSASGEQLDAKRPPGFGRPHSYLVTQVVLRWSCSDVGAGWQRPDSEQVQAQLEVEAMIVELRIRG